MCMGGIYNAAIYTEGRTEWFGTGHGNGMYNGNYNGNSTA